MYLRVNDVFFATYILDEVREARDLELVKWDSLSISHTLQSEESKFTSGIKIK